MTKLPVVVIDDDTIHLTLVHRLMERFYGFSVETVRGGTAGIVRLKSFRDSQTPAIVLLDLNMPDVDGYEILDMIAHTPAFRHIHIIVISTSDEPEDIIYAKRLGFTNYLVKPLNHKHLIEKIDSINQIHQSPSNHGFDTHNKQVS